MCWRSLVTGLHWTSKYSRTVDANDKVPPLLGGTALTPSARLAFYLKLLAPPASLFQFKSSTLRLPGDLEPYEIAEDIRATMRQVQADMSPSAWVASFVAKINKDDTYD